MARSRRAVARSVPSVWHTGGLANTNGAVAVSSVRLAREGPEIAGADWAYTATVWGRGCYLQKAKRFCIMSIMKKRRKQKVSAQLRAVVKNADVSRYRISMETGVPQSILSRFARGEAGVSTATVDRLCDYFNLELVYKKNLKQKDRQPWLRE